MSVSKIDLTRQATNSAAVSLNNFQINNLATPSVATDAANKSYVDSVAQGLDAKPSVYAVATSNVSTSGTQTIDGVALAAGNRVLLTGQTTASQNGIWLVASGSWTRPSDFATGSSQLGVFVFVQAGTANSSSGWVLTGNSAVTVDTSSQTWTQFSGAGEIIAGTGLSKSGNSLQISSTYIGQTSITTLGTIATGVWNGTTIALANGGTGATTQQGAANNILPSQSGSNGYYLTTNGTNVSWAQVAASATFRRTTLSGTQDGNNKSFTIANAVTTSSEQIIQNGIVLNPGSTNDYTISGTTITFTNAPAPTDALQAFGSY